MRHLKHSNAKYSIKYQYNPYRFNPQAIFCEKISNGNSPSLSNPTQSRALSHSPPHPEVINIRGMNHRLPHAGRISTDLLEAK